MWLINVHTLELCPFLNSKDVPYAILSHTWGDEEVTFKDYQDLQSARRKKGFAKIEKTAENAREQGFQWAWVDTCCIDKSSSAELSEAINSMFQWYRDSAVCFAYLEDLPTYATLDTDADSTEQEVKKVQLMAFAASRWMTRGWTLQELIAPHQLEFYDQEWNFYNTRDALAGVLEVHTGIDRALLSHEAERPDLGDYSVACRMSWAAYRKTTRIEDSAYCLLGLFGVNMGLLYGEGSNAFMRLQEEICRNTTDLSLFAWTAEQSFSIDEILYRGIFAQDASEFGRRKRIMTRRLLQTDYREEFAVTNRGIKLDNMPLWVSQDHGIIMDLNCFEELSRTELCVPVICLEKTIDGFVRSRPTAMPRFRSMMEIEESCIPVPPSRVIIPKSITFTTYDNLCRRFDGAISISAVDDGIYIEQALPDHLWDPLRRTFISGMGHFAGCIIFRAADRGGRVGTLRTYILLCTVHNDNYMQDYHPSMFSYSLLGETDNQFGRMMDLIKKTKMILRPSRRGVLSYNETQFHQCYDETVNAHRPCTVLADDYQVVAHGQLTVDASGSQIFRIQLEREFDVQRPRGSINI